MEKQAEDQTETSLASSSQEQLPSQKEGHIEKTVADDCSSANQTDKISPDNSSSDGADVPKGRPMSPGTLALMCDEQDTMFMTTASPIAPMAHACNTSSQFPYGQGMTEVYPEQERIVLTKFRDFLNRVITMGEINGKLILSSFSYKFTFGNTHKIPWCHWGFGEKTITFPFWQPYFCITCFIVKND